MAQRKSVDMSSLLEDSCPELIAMNLLKTNPNISIRELQGTSGLSYNQASVLKKAFVSGRPEILEKTIAEIVRQSIESVSALQIVHAKLSEHFRFEVEDERPIGIAALFDLHCGGTGVAHSLMKSDFEVVRDTEGMYALCGGDYTDNFIKSSMTSAVMDAVMSPQQQLDLFESALDIIEPKVIAMISGNHDLWTKYLAGVDSIKRICNSRRLAYAPHQLRVQVALPGREYAIGVRHQGRYNSSKNPGHAIKTWRKEVADWPFDIGMIGHNHEAHIESFRHESKECWAVRPGTYKVVDDFSQRFGYPTALPVMPVVILFPRERRIMCFSDIRSGAEVLTALRRLPASERKTFFPEIKPLEVTVVKSSELGDNHSTVKPNKVTVPKRKK